MEFLWKVCSLPEDEHEKVSCFGFGFSCLQFRKIILLDGLVSGGVGDRGDAGRSRENKRRRRKVDLERKRAMDSLGGLTTAARAEEKRDGR